MSKVTVAEQTDNGQLTAAEARQIVAQEQKQRVEQCRVELQQLLDRHKCRLDVSILIRAGQIIPQVEIIPVE